MFQWGYKWDDETSALCEPAVRAAIDGRRIALLGIRHLIPESGTVTATAVPLFSQGLRSLTGSAEPRASAFASRTERSSKPAWQHGCTITSACC